MVSGLFAIAIITLMFSLYQFNILLLMNIFIILTGAHVVLMRIFPLFVSLNFLFPLSMVLLSQFQCSGWLQLQIFPAGNLFHFSWSP